MGAYGRNHLQARSYLSGWVAAGALLAHPVGGGLPEPKKAESVGYRRRFWSENPAVRRDYELACSRLEGHIPRLLSGLERGQLPREGEGRATLAEFIALHVLRTEAFREWHTAEVEHSIAKAEADPNYDGPLEEVAEKLREPDEWLETFENTLASLGSAIGSMHLTFLKFEEPLLITGDHPVAAVPLMRPGQFSPFRGFPPGGCINTMEFRMPLTPSFAVIASWADRREARITVEAGEAEAVNLNLATIGLARRHWFSTPRRLPALPDPLVLEQRHSTPLTTTLIPGYGYDAIVRSDRRKRTFETIERKIEEGSAGKMTILRPTYDLAA